MLKKALNWQPHPPFFYGWLVLGMGALGAFVATSVAGVVLGGIQSFIVADTGWKRSTIGLTAAVGVWGSGLAAPFLGRLADRYGPRILMPLGTLLLGMGLFALGVAHSRAGASVDDSSSRGIKRGHAAGDLEPGLGLRGG